MGDILQTPQFQMRRLKKQLADERNNRDELELELAEHRKLLTEKGGYLMCCGCEATFEVYIWGSSGGWFTLCWPWSLELSLRLKVRLTFWKLPFPKPCVHHPPVPASAVLC